MWSRPAVAPASMSSISRAICLKSPGGQAISMNNISRASRHGGRMRAWKTSVRRSGSTSDSTWCPQMHEGGAPTKLLAMFCANVIHIAPWRVAEGLFAGAGRYLQQDGRLFLYGPFKRGGKHTAVSNEVFDASLRERNGEWGVRDIEALEKLAARAGLALIDITDMPANNLTLVFERSRAA